MVTDTHSIRFRPLAESDLPLMLEWLNRPHMLRWWRDRVVNLSDWWPDEPGPGVVGIDQFLGDGDRLGQGLGTAMVGAFCRS